MVSVYCNKKINIHILIDHLILRLIVKIRKRKGSIHLKSGSPCKQGDRLYHWKFLKPPLTFQNLRNHPLAEFPLYGAPPCGARAKPSGRNGYSPIRYPRLSGILSTQNFHKGGIYAAEQRRLYSILAACTPLYHLPKHINSNDIMAL